MAEETQNSAPCVEARTSPESQVETLPQTRKPWHPPEGRLIDVASITRINAGVGADGIACHS